MQELFHISKEISRKSKKGWSAAEAFSEMDEFMLLCWNFFEGSGDTTSKREGVKQMEKEPLRRYLIFLAALIICAGAVWYLSSDVEYPKENAILAGGRNLIIDLGTAGEDGGILP